MSKPCFTPLDVLNVINGSIGHILESKKSNEDTKSSEALSRAVEVFESIDVEAEFSGLFLDARETVPKVKSILKNLVDLERKEKNIAAADKSQTQTTKEEKETADSADSHILEEELNVSFKDIVGSQAAKSALYDNVILPLSLPLHLKQQLFTGIRKGGGNILLHGPPGTGKTLLVRACAREAGVRLLCVKPSDVLSKYQGESETRLKAIFQQAQKHPHPDSGSVKTNINDNINAERESWGGGDSIIGGRTRGTILFFDEIDALAAARGGGDDGGQARRLLSELLLQLNTLQTRNFVKSNSNSNSNSNDTRASGQGEGERGCGVSYRYHSHHRMDSSDTGFRGPPLRGSSSSSSDFTSKETETPETPETYENEIPEYGGNNKEGIYPYGSAGSGSYSSNSTSSSSSREGSRESSRGTGTGTDRKRRRRERAGPDRDMDRDIVEEERGHEHKEEIEFVEEKEQQQQGQDQDQEYKDPPFCICIAATNRAEDLDEAVVRRFSIRVRVEVPGSAAERAEMIQNFLHGVQSDLTSQQLIHVAEMTCGWSGADLEALTREAAMAPLRRLFPQDGNGRRANVTAPHTANGTFTATSTGRADSDSDMGLGLGLGLDMGYDMGSDLLGCLSTGLDSGLGIGTGLGTGLDTGLSFDTGAGFPNVMGREGAVQLLDFQRAYQRTLEGFGEV